MKNSLWQYSPGKINNPISYKKKIFFEPEKSYPQTSVVYCIFALFWDHLSKSLKILRWIALLHFLRTLLIFYNILWLQSSMPVFFERFPILIRRKFFSDCEKHHPFKRMIGAEKNFLSVVNGNHLRKAVMIAAIVWCKKLISLKPGMIGELVGWDL